VSARPDSHDAVRIPSGEHAGRPLDGLAETTQGWRWLRWALRYPDWDREFREALNAYVRTNAPLIWHEWLRERRGAL
jgi:hypothetical protein